MKYNFEREVDRSGTNAVKWELIQDSQDRLNWKFTEQFYGDDRILPMWVADMDFRSPQPVIDALVGRAEHGIYGYSAPTKPYFASVVGWMHRRHGWNIQPEWISTTPGVVPAIYTMVHTFSAPGEKVLVQPPVYYPFFSAIQENDRELVTNPLVFESGRYRMDYADLEEKLKDPKVKMAILCNPHNPVGRVWSRDELVRFGEICLQNDVLVVADELHGDLILKNHIFTPFATASDSLAQKAVICTAPSKTFNLAGLHTSNIIIPDAEKRAKFDRTLRKNGLFGLGVFGIDALQAAYNEGETWLQELLVYIEGNLECLEDFICNHIPQISVVRPEGTYLVWLDCRRLELDKWELKRLMLQEARVYLEDGFIFGDEGDGFVRINIACPRSILTEALERIKSAIAQL